jgi:hypothetical protein
MPVPAWWLAEWFGIITADITIADDFLSQWNVSSRRDRAPVFFLYGSRQPKQKFGKQKAKIGNDRARLIFSKSKRA